jgi:rhodanese-related sulfurtransferase
MPVTVLLPQEIRFFVTMIPERAQDLPLEVDIHTVHAWLDSRRDWVLIDCREESEHAMAAIDGAELMPMSRWPEVSAKLQAWGDRHLVVHCHHGGRSLRVVQWLRQHGFPTAQSMAGGIDAWSLEIDPQIPRY